MSIKKGKRKLPLILCDFLLKNQTAYFVVTVPPESEQEVSKADF